MRISIWFICFALLGGALALLMGNHFGGTAAIAQPPFVQQTATPVGCFRDSTNPSDLDLNGYLERSMQNTPARCAATCAARGFRYAGVQFGESCLCGQNVGRFGAAQNCTMRCTGDPNQICGGMNANSVYQISGGAMQPPPPPPAFAGPSGFTGPALTDRGLSVTKLSGQSIRIDWAGMPGGDRDWVSLVPAGTPDTSHVGMWVYAPASGSREYGVGTALGPGNYEVRFYLNDSYIVYRRVPFSLP